MRGGRQAFDQTWLSDLENRVMVTKINQLLPHDPNNVSKLNKVFYPFQLYNQPSLVWICEIGGRQAFGQTWPSDLENRAMVTKINHLFPSS